MSKRDGVPLWKSLGIRLIGLTLALIVCAVIIYALTQLNPLKVYAAMFKGALALLRRLKCVSGTSARKVRFSSAALLPQPA